MRAPALRAVTWPRSVLLLAIGFWLVTFLIQVWRLETLSATYDQALFLQELWSTSQGRPFESSLSSVLSGAVTTAGALPWVTYLHLGQHANFLTLVTSPLVVALGRWALPFIQVSALTAAGLVLWRIASRRLDSQVAFRITVAYFLSGAVLGPAIENFHDLIWIPLLGFLVVEALMERRHWQLLLSAVLLLLVREDSGLVLFSIGLWALIRRPSERYWGFGLMLVSLGWVLIITGWLQPAVDSSLADRFLAEKFGHLVEDPSGGTVALMLTMLRQPLAVLQALVSPPGATLGFVMALTLPLLFIPLLSVDALLLVSAPLFVALVSQGRTALAVTLRYVLALVPGLYLGAVLWWQAHPRAWHHQRVRAVWTGVIALGLAFTIVSNPHRSFSAVVPDSFVPWIHVPPMTMLHRREAALKAVANVPDGASVAADTPLLPLLAQREALIRFPNSVQFKDREGEVRSVDYVVTFPGYYTPLAPVFKHERRVQIKIRDQVQELLAKGDYQLIHCEAGALVLRRVPDRVPGQKTTPGIPSHCDALA